MNIIMSQLLRTRMIAPWATLALIATMSMALPNRVEFDEASVQRRDQISEAMSSAPFFIGPWIGEDTPVLREAQELLRPNAILSRSYQRPGVMRLHLLLVHCSDARDMIGHYPPICYPSSGWVRVPVADHDGDIEIIVDENALPMRTYLFRRVEDHGVEEVIRIFNAFILPDGSVTRDIDDINRQSERLVVSVRGVAQVQIVSEASVSQEKAVAAAQELLMGMPALLEALGIGQGEKNEL